MGAGLTSLNTECSSCRGSQAPPSLYLQPMLLPVLMPVLMLMLPPSEILALPHIAPAFAPELGLQAVPVLAPAFQLALPELKKGEEDS